ncbi:DNA repair protein RadA [Ferruginivarius sediminum]|uniref:DNA repair protein RadA n=1 Tax=Ferruginivarius sediminum TaxID=2661937 RepID=A0A369TB39_9PROT|nr:DNA repair protein RadA [Ferruginivarius sediminum]RDD62498.1 DNA repair protein RadA [Ferruginivarius sediminum]
MAKAKSQYVCQACGTVHAKWMGRCEGCGEWNTLVEEAAPDSPPGGLGQRRSGRGKRVEFVELSGQSEPQPRRVSGIAEFDRVCGGGLVGGSAVLVGGDPGIGKSTLALQVAARLSRQAGTTCAYISGEEAIDQVRLRARRLGLADSEVMLAAATSVRDIASALDASGAADVVVIDSIQTMYVDVLDSAPGTVSQVRAAAQELVRLAKVRGFTVVLVGHVTKEGLIAGPKVLEHMVDTVLYFEGERGHQFRILRAVKNRYGPTDEIGVFEMTDGGLVEVTNPSALFLAERRGHVAGAAVFAGMEGTRPVLVEIQALVANSALGTPRRAVVGWDSSRLSMVIAVLEARCGVLLGGKDVYLNVAGGLRVSEPAADLAVAAALISAAADDPVAEETVVFGEIGLSGEIRAVGQREQRLKEAAKLGFAAAWAPPQRSGRGKPATPEGIAVQEMGHLSDLVARFGRVQPSRSASTAD